MDISSLLSPSDGPRASSSTPSLAGSQNAPPHLPSPFKHAGVQRSNSGPAVASSPNNSSNNGGGNGGNGAQPAISSPLARAIQPPSSIPAHVRSPSQQPAHSSPLISPVPAGPSGSFARTPSTQSMDTLADLAAMQNHQPSRPTPPVLGSRHSSDSQKSAVNPFPHLSSAPTSNPRASMDIAMVETPKQVLRSDFTDTTLPLESQQRLSELVAYVQQTPSSYETHREIVTILHQGFVDHIYPSSSPHARRDPKTYDLLPELRRARETLDQLFGVGEDQWLDWLQDESILAQSAEDRVAVVDKCRRAVDEEHGSTKLWVTYGDWVMHCHKWAHDPPGGTDLDPGGDPGPDAERMVGRDVFEWELIIDTWTEAVQRTQHDLAHSHEVWDKFMRAKFGDLTQKLSAQDATAALDHFLTRLHVPHARWEDTFQDFSTFVSANFPPDQYEPIMAQTLRDSANAKTVWPDRDRYETAIDQAQRIGDLAAEYEAWLKYVEFERAEESKARSRRKGKGKRDRNATPSVDLDLVAAVYQRAELRFPTVLQLWQEHIDHLLEQPRTNIIDLLSRASKHCPWSGALWKQYLLTSEILDMPFVETEKIKHKATSTGLLDAAGLEEALVVYDAWCGYLLRRTKRPEAIEEDADVAEMGIRSSIEAVHSLATKLGSGRDFDPSFRLQRKYVEYLKSQGRLDNARAQFDDAVADYGKHYKFWLRFYEFELQKSVQMAFIQKNGPERALSLSSAPFAAGVLKEGLQHPNLDYPEYLIEALLNHCEDYEDADDLQGALSLVRKAQKALAARRQEEALQAQVTAEQAEHAEAEIAHQTDDIANGLHIGKRKRHDEINDDIEASQKRQRNEATPLKSVESPVEAAEQLKRDREHASILVQNLPSNISDTRLRQFFSNCGTVKFIKRLDDEEQSVVIEFADADEAAFALSRDGQDLDNAILSVVLNTGSTLYVTNYPATADEIYIRNLLLPYGEIVNVRFPSLQKNKKRRFCYVEFKLPAEAQAATEVDGREIDGLNIQVKISDPSHRKQRSERKIDDRTVFVGQLPFKATVDDIKRRFEEFGKIVDIQLPHDAKTKNRNRGIAFIKFDSVEAVHTAVAAMDGQEFMGRNIKTNVTGESYHMRPVSRSINGHSQSPSFKEPGSSENLISPQQDNLIDKEDQQQRTIAISDVPDTVNESRIRAVTEKFGAVRKVVLKTNHAGAVIEFREITDAGRAALELDGYEIIPSRKIRVVTQKELYEQKPEKKFEQFTKKPIATSAIPTTMTTGPIRRPGHPTQRKGGNLGHRSAMLYGDLKGGSSTSNGPDAPANRKTNDDFRAMFDKKG